MTIKVGGKTWTIKRRKMPDHWGRADWPERIIWIDSGLSGNSLANTLLHEVAHAADYETEEVRIEVLAAAQTQALVKLGFLSEEET